MLNEFVYDNTDHQIGKNNDFKVQGIQSHMAVGCKCAKH